MTRAKIKISEKNIIEFCQANRIQKMSLFGSVLSDDFNMESDVDVLVELKPGIRIGLIGLTGLEFELGEILGRKVD